MKYCPKCNAEANDYYQFCEECGTNLRIPVIKKPKTSIAKNVKKEEIEDLKKRIEDSEKEFEQESASINVLKKQVQKVEEKRPKRKTRISKKKITQSKTQGKRIFPIKFKFPKLSFMKGIKKLKKPEFIK